MKSTHISLVHRLLLPALLAGAVSVAHAQTLTSHYQQRSLIDFEGMTVGASPATATDTWTAAWSSGTGLTGQTPKKNTVGGEDVAYNPSNIALQATDTTRRSSFSPLQAPVFTAADQNIYFSAWVNRGSSATSGVGIILDQQNAGAAGVKLGGFRIMDAGGTSAGHLAFYTTYWEANPEEGDPRYITTWVTSDFKTAADTWYEVAMVVQLNEADWSKSLGSLYVRDVNAEETDFTLVTFSGESSIEMSWYTEDLNARDSFSYWRVENFRNNTQIDNLATGVIAIPEPSTASILLLSGLAVGGYRLYNKKRARR